MSSARLDSGSLFNAASFEIVVPNRPLPNSPPTSSTNPPSSDPVTEHRTDEWIASILNCQPRPKAYFDEYLSFYLIVSLPPTPALSRLQATTFFLDSVDQPHLTLAPSISLYDSSQSTSSFERQQLESSIRPSSTSALANKVPLTPAPFPLQTPGTNGTNVEVLKDAIPVTSSVNDGDEEETRRVWIGREPQGRWVAVWEFGSSLGFARTSFIAPRLALTITATFRDDPRLDRLLDKGRAATVNGDKAGAAEDEADSEEEGYMDDSYDDVNLLSALAPSHSLHLPFSRLPSNFLPPLSTAPPSTTNHARRHSRTRSLASSISTTLSSDPNPLLRRSILKTLPIFYPLQVSIRTVRCPVGALGHAAGERAAWEGNEEGMILNVEVSGPTTMDEDERFEIEHIEVSVSGGSTPIVSSGGGIRTSPSSDIEVREINGERNPETVERIRLSGTDQHNFLYALSMAPSALSSVGSSLALMAPVEGGSSQAQDIGTVPIAVATSPSQRFTARFGANDEYGGRDGQDEDEKRRREGLRQRDGRRREEGWRRNVSIIIKGQVVGACRGDDTKGYTVDEGGGEARAIDEKAKELVEATEPFLSKSNFVIDVSSFARQPPPTTTFFRPPPSGRDATFRPTSFAAPPVPLLPPSAIRPRPTSAATSGKTEVESVAGSKRHTMASLASLSLKSPILDRHSSLPPVRPNSERRPSRALPSLPPSAFAPTVSSGARRFFSLPPTDEAASASSQTTPQNPYSIARTETPTPMNASPANIIDGKRTSLPLPAEPTRRTSWMNGLGIGNPRNSLGTSPNGAVENGGRTTWDRSGPTAGELSTNSNGLGLGFEGTAQQPQLSSLPIRPSEIDHVEYQNTVDTNAGRVLITVSLVPLRTVKSRRFLESKLVQDQDDNLPPPTLPGLALDSSLSPPTSHHASFNFPASPSPSSPSSPSASPNPGAPSQQQTTSIERSNLLTSRMPRVGLLDVFLVQLFVVNQTDQVKRFVVSIPPPRTTSRTDAPLNRGGASDGNRKSRGEHLGIRSGAVPAATVDGKEEIATLVPLENDVRIGPLAPNTCASLGLRMLAISPGAHVVEELKIVDIGDGSETRLERPLWVVVE